MFHLSMYTAHCDHVYTRIIFCIYCTFKIGQLKITYRYILVTCGKTNKRILSTIKSCNPPFIYRSDRLCWHTTWQKWTTSVIKRSTMTIHQTFQGVQWCCFTKQAMSPKALYMFISSSKVIGVLPSPNGITTLSISSHECFYFVSAVLTWTCQYSNSSSALNRFAQIINLDMIVRGPFGSTIQLPVACATCFCFIFFHMRTMESLLVSG